MTTRHHKGNACDFCSAPFVHRLYPCLIVWRGGSRTLFAACQKCGKIIDAGEWPKLIRRTMRHARDIHAPREKIRDLRELLAKLPKVLQTRRAFTVYQRHYKRVQAIHFLC